MPFILGSEFEGVYLFLGLHHTVTSVLISASVVLCIILFSLLVTMVTASAVDLCHGYHCSSS